MKGLRAIGKEQWTLIAAALVSAWLVYGAASGSVPATKTMTLSGSSDRLYSGPPSAGAEFVREKFEDYWSGRDIFRPATADRLPLPDLTPPVPKAEALVLLPLRPGPRFEHLNRVPLANKYRSSVGSVSAADLPEAAIGALRTLAEPDVVIVPDKRHERMHGGIDTVHVEGKAAVRGRIVVETAEYVDIQNENNIRQRIPRKDIALERGTARPRIDRGWTHAEEYKDRAARLKPGDAQGHVTLAKWCKESGMLAEARTEFLAAIETLRSQRSFTTEFAGTVGNAGGLMMEMGDVDGAVKLYTDVLTWTDVEKAETAGRVGDALRSLGLVESAIEAYQQSLEASPRFARGRIGLARAFMELGRDAEAVTAMQELFAKYESVMNGVEKSDAYAVRGLAMLRTGEPGAAQEAFEEAVRLDPRNGEAMNGLGVSLVLLGRIKEGAERFVQAININQYVVDAWLNLAGLTLGAGKVAEADALYAAALQRDPACVDAVCGLAMALAASAKSKEAIAKLDEALVMDPRHYFARYARGQLRLAEGAVEDARAEFAQALQSEFYFLPAYSGAALTYLVSARALEAGPGDPNANRAAAGKHRVNAETLLTTLRDFDPQRASSHVALGCVLAVQGRGADAERCFLKALEVDPTPSPLMAYGRGYVAYWYGEGDAETRLATARSIFQHGATLTGDADWIAACTTAVKLVGDWMETRVHLDDRFARPASEEVGGGWIQRHKEFGILIKVEKNERVSFTGKQNIKEALTQLEREIPKDEFYSFEVTLYPKPGKYEYGVSFYHSQLGAGDWNGQHVGVDLAGKLRQGVTTEKRLKETRLDFTGAQEVKVKLTDPKEMRLKFERFIDEKRRQAVLGVYVWDPAKQDWLSLVQGTGTTLPHAGAAAKAFRICIWTRAALQQDVHLEVDNVRVLQRRLGN